MRTPRIIKQVFYLAFYIAVFSLIIYQVISYIKSRPTCIDGKMNQNETGIDCGGKCQPCPKEYVTKDLVVTEKSYVSEGIGRYDLVAKVKNPNSNVGSSSFTYQFILTDSSGKQIISKEGKGFIDAIGKVKGFERFGTKKLNKAYIAASTEEKDAKRVFNNFNNIEIGDVRNIHPVDILKYKYLIITKPEQAFKMLESKLNTK